jgi:uncharacterized membrane protein
MRYTNALLLVIGILFCAEWLNAASFTPLPQLPLWTQAGDAFGVSADGSTVVGTSHDGYAFQAVRWKSTGEIELLNAGDFSYAWASSADGNVIVGYKSVEGGISAFRWTPATGAVPLRDFAGRIVFSKAIDVSSDGSVIAGNSSAGVFRWTESTGMVTLDGAAGATLEVHGISANGSVIVGQNYDTGTAFRWAIADGMVDLGRSPSGSGTAAFDVSADGSVIVGGSPFRWTSQSGIVPLTLFPTGFITAISGDGNVIVGATRGQQNSALTWDEIHGSRRLSDLLQAQGVDIEGWDLQIIRGISYDGLTLVGLGINPDYKQQPWMVRLDEGTFIPEPSTLACAAAGVSIGILALLRRRKRNSSAPSQACLPN